MPEKKELSFEEKLGRLEEIVRSIEKGDLPLEETLKLVEEGRNLSKSLEETLKKAEEKLSAYTVDGEDNQ